MTALPSQIAAMFRQAQALHQRGQLFTAQAMYEEILDVQPQHFGAMHFLGVIAAQTNQAHRAVELMGKSLQIHQRNAIAYNNYANALMSIGRCEAAIEIYGKAITLDGKYADAYYNRGLAFTKLKRYDEAIESYDRALEFNPDFAYLVGLRRFLKMMICDWRGVDDDLAILAAGIERNKAVSNPLSILAMFDNPALHRKAAQIWAGDHPSNTALPVLAASPEHERIRIGYFSPDFRYHPVALLTAGLFETHDRSRFEVTAFSFGPNTQDETRRRMEGAFEHFIDVRDKSDLDIALLAREMEIDIAVDLAGYTDDSRPTIFANRAAPIQISYLGYPGTMAAGYMDYLIADPVLIPTDSQLHYAEKIIYLPNSYQANDSTRCIADATFTRAEFRLPEKGFVFCCFNTAYKITPRTFDGWMRILKRVDGSVLWLSENNRWAVTHLREAAACRGVNADRLIFAKRMPLPSEHLARQRLGDLFIDTLPYNAHTTASDALWAGVPVLTCVGNAFAGRVVASLLTALGLPELAVASESEYEELAVELALDSRRLAAIKQRLADSRLTAPLFDTRLFTRSLEFAYAAVHERRRAGLSPEHVYL